MEELIHQLIVDSLHPQAVISSQHDHASPHQIGTGLNYLFGFWLSFARVVGSFVYFSLDCQSFPHRFFILRLFFIGNVWALWTLGGLLLCVVMEFGTDNLFIIFNANLR